MKNLFNNEKIGELKNYFSLKSNELVVYKIMLFTIDGKLYKEDISISEINYVKEWEMGVKIFENIKNSNLPYDYTFFFIISFQELVIKLSEYLVENKSEIDKSIIDNQQKFIELIKDDRSLNVNLANMYNVKSKNSPTLCVGCIAEKFEKQRVFQNTLKKCKFGL